MNVFYYGIKCGQKFFFVLSQFKRFTDRRTGGQTDIFLRANTALHSMQRG